MKAVVVHAAGDLRIEDRPIPAPGPGEVLLALEWGGICGSDVAYHQHGGSGTAKLRAPLVLGHEFAGRVAQLGPGVAGPPPGSPVAVYPAAPAAGSALPDRLAGRVNLLPEVRYYGSAALFPHTDGGFCEYKTVRADQLVPLPAAVGTRLGALAEPLAVAIHAVRRAIGAFGDLRRAEILVNGVGPIGALVVAVAKRFGAGLVVASDVTPAALGIGRAMGADDAVNAATGPLPAEVPLVFEASGAAAALGAVLRATARGGVLVQVGNLPARPVSAVLGDLVTREITWLGSFRFVGEMSQAVELLADGLDIEPIITHSFPLAQAAEAMAVAADRRTGSSKVMLDLSRPAEPPAPLPGPTSNQGESNAES